MEASIITIGDEILIGQVVDTNSTFMATELSKVGVRVKQIYSISDTEEAIISTLSSAVQQSDIVLLTGGLGPTKDDITKLALAKYFNCKLVRHQPSLEKVEERLRQYGIRVSEINRTQADVPEVCTVLKNHPGLAPGMLFHEDGKMIVSMPGVPFEMKDIMTTGVIPYLKENFDLPALMHKTFLTIGVGESMLAERLDSFENKLTDNFSVAYLPSPGSVRIRLSAFGDSQEEMAPVFHEKASELEELLASDLFGYNDDTLEGVVAALLKKQAYTIATAESCTGGNIARKLTSIPGASKYFKGSIVAYCNDIKNEVLGVSRSNLIDFGAVSKEVVEEMALNVKSKLKADFGVATSGVAGPDGGTVEKPVGTVWVAIASPNGVFSIKYSLGKNRERTVTRSTALALDLIRKEINNIVEKTVNKV